MVANTANSTLTTNFNITPYFDDYDETKNYYRILFKPGFAVQARELTQIQSTLQKQIDRFGKHVFKEGSIVLPGTPSICMKNSIEGPVNYVRVRDVDASNNSVSIKNFLDKEVVGLSTGITGIINFVVDGSESNVVNKTIYVDYTSASNSNSAITVFQPGELLATSEGTLVAASSNTTGKGSAIYISEGVLFAKEHFIKFPTVRAILDPYNDIPTCQVGFTLIEKIVSSADDNSLLDPALESSNYSAPGADRLLIDPILTVRNVDDDVGPPDYVTVYKIRNGVVETSNDRPLYNILGDEMAKRTFDESGHYYVNGLNVSLREHLDNGTNGGYSLSGNSQLLSVQVSSGKAFVSGYERELLTTQYITTEKSTEYETDFSQLSSATMGSYVTVNELVGNWVHDTGIEIELYDAQDKRISQKNWSSTSPSGNKIGTAKLMAVEYNSGISGTANGKYDVYISNINMMGSNSFSSVKSIYYNNTGSSDIGADVVLSASNTAILKDTSNFPMLYNTGSNYTKSIKPNNISDTTFIYKHNTTVADISSGIFNVSLPSGADSFPYTSSASPITLSNSQKREIILTIDADAEITLTGTVSNTGLTIVGASGADFTNLNVGDKIEMSGISGTYTISTITDSTHLTVSEPLATTASGSTFKKVYKQGDILDLTGVGADSGDDIEVTSTTSILSFDLGQTLNSSTAASVSYRVSSQEATEIDKILRTDRFVIIDCSSAGTTGPFGLGLSDVYKIKEIRLRRDGTTFTSNTEGSSAQSYFTFNNGQTDTHYDHATITPNITLTSNDRILVRLDYFYPDISVGQGFFSIDSYPNTIDIAEIPIYKSPSSGSNYDLRNHLDFRPVKAATASDSTTVGGASTNPSSSAAFVNDGNGVRIPAPYSQINFDYEYYIARKDVVYLDKSGIVYIQKGIPSVNPITPTISDDKMSLATLHISPYPSISLFYAKQINRRDIASKVTKTSNVRFTMRDIGVLRDRIINLENYVSLSLLEKNALDFKILDENGLDRFKNGIFVDTFENHILGATYNPDYRIVIDPQEKCIRPVYTTNSVYYDYSSGSNVIKVGDLLLLDYDEERYFTQNAVTTTRNTERTTYRFIGKMEVTPDSDVWVDTEYAPDDVVQLEFSENININDPRWEFDIEYRNGVTTEWGSWRKYVSGYKVYRSGGIDGGQTLYGEYSTLDEANAAANYLSRAEFTAATIETLYKSERSGIQFNYGTDYDTYRLGEKVIDTKIIPYIRPQILRLDVQYLKPYARYYPYFDDIIMSNNVISFVDYEADHTQTSLFGNETELYADGNGRLTIAMSIPSDNNRRFTTGTKQIKLTDSPNNNTEDETSFARTHFFADGLKLTKQRTIITTRSTVRSDSTLYEERNDPSTFVNIPAERPPWIPGGEGCMAYAFQIKTPNDEEGLFVTSIDLFVAEKHPTFGVWFEILECDDAGYPMNSTVPFSVKTFTNSDVPISETGLDNPLTITFNSPVFLSSKRTYALAIHPEAINENYYFWAARIGETDINTGSPVNSRLYKGTTFTTNNGVVWQVVPDLDLTININRASFITNVTGNAILVNKPREKLYVQNVSSRFTVYGEKMLSGDKLSLSSISGGTINLTDLIIGTSSIVNSSVVSISSTYNMSNTGYISGESVTVSYANGVSKGITATISSIEPNANAIVEKSSFDGSNAIVHLTNSNGRFSANDKIFTYSRSKSVDITTIGDYRYSVVNFEPSLISFNYTDIRFKMKTYSNTGTEGTFTSIDPESDYYFTTERKLYSRSNEVSNFSGDSTNQLQVNMSTTSSYISPILDLLKTQSLLIDNIVNNDSTNEDGNSGGNLYNKYISKIITLAENQDAEDIKLILTAYRPPTSDVKVWIKIKHNEDGDPFNSKNWIELERSFEGDNEYSSLSNKNDFKEFQYNFPSTYLTADNGSVQYTQSGSGVVFTGYKNFSIKIGLLAENSAIIPRVSDLRVIALQI